MRAVPSVTCTRNTGVMRVRPTARFARASGYSRATPFALSSARVSSLSRLFRLTWLAIVLTMMSVNRDVPMHGKVFGDSALHPIIPEYKDVEATPSIRNSPCLLNVVTLQQK